jgi:hypothetical protein
MTQGGWTSADTIFKHYRTSVLDDQVRAFEKMTGRAVTDHDEPELPGYG